MFRLSRIHKRVASRARQRGFVRLSTFVARWGSSAFRVRDLFKAGEIGAHYELYDPVALYPRRNQLTYSSQFSNAAWTQTNILSVTDNADGIGDLVVPNTTAAAHTLTQNVAIPGVANTVHFRAKAGGWNFVSLQLNGMTVIWFNVATGVVSLNGGGYPTTAAPAAGAPGYFDFSVSGIPNGTPVQLGISNVNGATSQAGDGTSGVYFARAQVEWNTTTPSAYQDITDWYTEYLAATPVESIGQWQTTTGIPVTNLEQPVGVWMDSKAGKWTRGKDVLNGGFDTDTVWTKGSGWTISGGVATDASGTSAITQIAAETLSVGDWVEVKFTIVSITGGFAYPQVAGTAQDTTQRSNAAGTYTWLVRVATVLDQTVGVTCGNTPGTIVIDNFSARKLAGGTVHATQVGTTNRPILSAKVQLITKSEQFDDPVWSKASCTVTANTSATTAPDGSQNADLLVYAAAGRIGQTITLPVAGTFRNRVYVKKSNRTYVYVGSGNTGAAISSGALARFNLDTGTLDSTATVGSGWSVVGTPTITAVGGGWYAVSVDVATTTTAGTHYLAASASNTGLNSDAAAEIYAWGADSRLIDDAAKNIPPYQRINTATDYDSTGFPLYLKFDGLDDGLQTASVDFSGRVNLLTKTDQFDDAAWTKTGITVTTNAITAPDGTLTADALVPDTTTGDHNATTLAVVIPSGSQGVLSVSLKAKGYGFAAITHGFGVGGGTVATVINLTTGAVVSTGDSVVVSNQGNGWWRVSITFLSNIGTARSIVIRPESTGANTTSYTGDGVNGIYAWGIDVRPASTPSFYPAYQRVNTATDYDYLPFGGCDKMSVWMGLTKNSDANSAIAFELGPQYPAAGGAGILAPDSAAAAKFSLGVGAGASTFARIATGANYAAPSSVLFTGLTDNSKLTIAAGILNLRINGVAVAVTTASDTFGSTAMALANGALNIGRRNNASVPFNGRVYSLTVRGTSTATSESFIAKMNRYAASLMAVSI